MCPWHHDRGTDRGFILDLLKRICLLPSLKSSRDSHRTIVELFSDRKEQYRYTLYILDSWCRGSHSEYVGYDYSTGRVMKLAYSDKLLDDFTLFMADHHNGSHYKTHPKRSAFNPHVEIQKIMMKQLKFDSYCCAASNVRVSEKSEEFVCKDTDYDFRGLPAFEYYAVENDHANVKNFNPAASVGKNIIQCFDEHYHTKSTCACSHAHRGYWQRRTRSDERCYFIP